MFPRCLVVCTLLLVPALPNVGPQNVVHIGRNIVLPAEQSVHNASCFLCSADIEGRSSGSVRVFAGHVLLNGKVGGNVLVFGGNVYLGAGASVGGHVLVFGGHLQQDAAAASPHRTVLAPIIFLPIILLICALISGLIVLTRRMVRGPLAYPPLPRM